MKQSLRANEKKRDTYEIRLKYRMIFVHLCTYIVKGKILKRSEFAHDMIYRDVDRSVLINCRNSIRAQFVK